MAELEVTHLLPSLSQSKPTRSLSKGPSGASGSGESGSSRLCLANIIFKSSEEGIEGGPAVHITEMWIPGLGGGDTENRYSVSKISRDTGGWTAMSSSLDRAIELNAFSRAKAERKLKLHLGCAQPGEKELSLSQGETPTTSWNPGSRSKLYNFGTWLRYPSTSSPANGLLPDDLVLALSMINYTEPESMGRLSDLSEATCTLHARSTLLAMTIRVIRIGSANSDRYYAIASQSCHYCYKRTGDLGDLDESISAVRRAVELCPGSHVGLPGFYAKLGELLSHLFEHSGQPEYLSKAISARERSVELAPEGHESLPNWLSDLGGSFESRFNISEDLEDIEEAISIRRRALKYAPADHPDRPWYLGDLGLSLYRRFQRSGVLEDITEAVSLQRQAVDLIPEGHTNLAFLLDSLGICLRSRFDRTGDLEDITEAVSSQRKAVNMTPEDHPDLPTYLNNLSLCSFPGFDIGSAQSDRLYYGSGTKLPMDLNNLSLCLRLRFESTGDLEDIAQAVSVQRKAVSLTSEDHPSLPFFLNSLSHCLYSQFEYTSDLNDIAEAVTFQRRAVDLVSEDQPHLPSFLDNLTLYLRSRFEKTAQSRGPYLRSGYKPTYLNNLSLSLRLRFEHTQTGQNLGDITEAISLQRKAICLSSEARPDLPFFLGVLCLCLHSEFEHTGELEKIVEAASIQRRAINLVSDDHPHLPFFLDNLSLCLRSQFEPQSGGPDFRGNTELSAYMDSLSHCLHSRFENTGDLQDITEAILLQRRVVDRTRGDPSFPVVLHTLNNCLHARFHHTGDLQDITEAISIHRRVMHLIPKGDTTHAYGFVPRHSHILRFQHTGNLEDITEAIAEQRRTVYLIPESHARLPACLHTLGLFLCRRFEETGDFEDLVEAISAQRKALKLTPEGHATIPLWINNLSGSVYYMFQKAGDPRDIDEAISLQRRALDLLPDGHIGIPRQLSNLGLFVLSRSEYAGDVGDLTEAISTQQRALDLTAEGHADLPRYLDNIGNLLHRSYRTAATSSFGAPRITLRAALKWARLLNRHYPQSPQLTSAFDIALNAAALISGLSRQSSPDKISLENDARNHIRLAREWDELLAKKAKRYRTILNIQLSSHGLRFRGEGATTEDGACASGRVAGPYRRVKVAEDGVCMLLHGLWEEVVKPILEAVGFFRPLSFLPLHAAGIYRGIQMESISDYVVSSYIPSVTALTQRVKHDHQIGEGVSGLFLTAQPKAPGAVTIPGTTKEVASIYAKATAYGLRVIKQEGDAVSADECLEFMDRFSSIHLACHASQNAAEPLQSRFRFHKGTLDLATIMRKNLKNADLAFLSACQTSTGEETLSDEAVHLAAGMLAAGYRRVVATMWQIKDSHAPGVADDFYEYLWTHRAEGSSSQFDGTMSAHALHHAIEQLRGLRCTIVAWSNFDFGF
ncbi:hypothetical protein FA13DRAFT_1716595 [Coprinellus micaceus]|uniref:CHAT domain-containing protein n=1 Tax=Coprinellus micaceus TaxID=71717 RepID=A0A4Y7SIQ0_COPMI|nr:hypothetical protein FA13DRAFT_1716595 [Coprinellus micaceus]